MQSRSEIADVGSRLTVWRIRAAQWNSPAAAMGIIVFGLILALPGIFALPPIDRDESRFAQASRQMLEAETLEGWVVPRIMERPRLNKPPLIYWLQAATVGVCTGGDSARDAIWMYRLPSVAAFVGILLVVWRLGAWMYDARVGAAAALILGTSPVFMWEARQARADMVMVFFTTLAMAMLWRIWRNDARRLAPAITLWTAVALGVLTKGPITPMVVLLAASTLRVLTPGRWRGRMIWWLGIAMTFALVAPWVALVMREVGTREYLSIITDETLGRAGEAKEGHSGPPGYHIIHGLGLFWPGAMLIGIGLCRACLRSRGELANAPRRGLATVLRMSARRPETFLLAWIVPSWLIFEVVSTKLPHYTMPLYPALAIISARMLMWAFGNTWRPGPWQLVGIAAWGIFGILALSAGPALLAELGEPNRTARIAGWTGSAMILGTGIVLATWLVRRRFARAAVLGISMMAAFGIIGIGLVLPGISRPWTTGRLVAELEKLDPALAVPIAGADYNEDSLIFQTRGRVRRIRAADIDNWLHEHPEGLVIVHHDRAKAAPDLEILSPPVSGYNYSRGRPVEVVIVRRRPGTP
ncbi:MAG: glycosyltransferase family 39 protein [Phycisphaeraceae bacterium]|nr:glycosyltransferase family 39 protein [Phycisphaeraceae bacterium]